MDTFRTGSAWAPCVLVGRELLEIRAVLGASTRLLHSAQIRKRRDSDGHAEQFARDRALVELRKARNPSCLLDHVERSVTCVKREVSPPLQCGHVASGLERPAFRQWQRALQLGQHACQAVRVLPCWLGDDVEVLRGADVAMRTDCNSADYYEANCGLIERAQQGAEVQHAHRCLAAPVIAVACLQSSCMRARRSL